MHTQTNTRFIDSFTATIILVMLGGVAIGIAALSLMVGFKIAMIVGIGLTVLYGGGIATSWISATRAEIRAANRPEPTEAELAAKAAKKAAFLKQMRDEHRDRRDQLVMMAEGEHLRALWLAAKVRVVEHDHNAA